MIRSTAFLYSLIFSTLLIAQNVKKTHDYQVFGNRFAQALFTDLSSPIYGNSTVALSDALAGPGSVLGYMVKNKELEYLGAALGQSVDELKKNRKVRKNEIKYELTLIKLKYNHGITEWGKAALEEVRIVEKENEKIPTADIILSIKQDKYSISIVLQNCMQTETQWILGDRIFTDGSTDQIAEDTETAKQLLSTISTPVVKEQMFEINTAWSSRKAILSYKDYSEKIILEDDQLKWTALKKPNFILLNDGTSSMGVYLTDREIGNAYSNKWSYRSKSKSIFFSSDDDDIIASKILNLKILNDQEMVAEYSDMGATVTYFLDFYRPGLRGLSFTEFKNSEWYKYFFEKIDVSKGAASKKVINKVYEGLAIFKNGEIAEIYANYPNPIDISDPDKPIYLFREVDLGGQRTKRSAISFIDKSELRAFIIGNELWLPKTPKKKELWALMSIQGPLSSFTIFQIPTTSKLSLVDQGEPKPEENRKLYLQKSTGETYQNMIVGFKKKSRSVGSRIPGALRKNQSQRKRLWSLKRPG